MYYPIHIGVLLDDLVGLVSSVSNTNSETVGSIKRIG